MEIHDIHGFDARRAANELLSAGFIAIDDISWQLVDCAWDEVLNALGHAADELVLARQRVETSLGPVFVIRDAELVSAAKARREVLKCRPAPKSESTSREDANS